ncbi:MAG: DUF4232 domain-containing protein [Jatrophihabitantaceae bacterium]
MHATQRTSATSWLCASGAWGAGWRGAGSVRIRDGLRAGCPPAAGPRRCADARPCRLDELRFAGQQHAGAGGTLYHRYLFVSHAREACTVIGYPTLGAVVGHRVVPIELDRVGEPALETLVANLPPGGTVEAMFGTTASCDGGRQGSGRSHRSVRVGLPTGGAVDVRASGLDTSCGVSAFRVGVGEPRPAAPPPVLRATLHPPRQLRAGRVAEYTVTLTNTSGRRYDLRPCPSYEEYAASGHRAIVRTYYLNCDAVAALGAHRSVTFGMRLGIPAGWRSDGPVKFGWLLQVDPVVGDVTQVPAA